MVFGVLLLVGTIRHTFDDLIGSAWGKTDLIVSGTADGVLPESRARDGARGARRARRAPGMLGGAFTRLDERGRAVEGRPGPMRRRRLRHDRARRRTTSAGIAGRQPVEGPELGARAQLGPRRAGSTSATALRMATPDGPVEMPTSSASSASRAASRSAARAWPRCRSRQPRPADRPAEGLPSDQRRARGQGRLEAVRQPDPARSSARARRSRRRRASASEVAAAARTRSTSSSTSSRGSRCSSAAS